jgi:hypothetical protein
MTYEYTGNATMREFSESAPRKVSRTFDSKPLFHLRFPLNFMAPKPGSEARGLFGFEHVIPAIQVIRTVADGEKQQRTNRTER